MTNETSNNLDNFVLHLRYAYELTLRGWRQSLNTLKQNESESMFSFLHRCINLYYRSRNQEAPDIDKIADDKIAMSDIVHYFLKGLKNEKVRVNLKMRLSTIKFKDLAKIAREIESALPESGPMINFIPENYMPSGLESKIDKLEKQLEQMVLKIDTKYDRSRTPKRKVRFGSRTPSRSKSRGRNRSYSRERSYGRQNSNSRYRSRGRSSSPKRTQFKIDYSRYTCYRCQKVGHIARWCRTKMNNYAK